MQRVALIGLDCAAPAVLFDRYRSEMPHLDGFLRTAGHGALRSCHPPITVPAWACMLSGRDAGELGVYGFRNRRAHDYGGYAIATAAAVDRPCVWDRIAAAGGEVILLGVPPSYPPRPVRGSRVGCFLTPRGAQQTTWPPELAAEIEGVAPGYAFDVEGFRGGEPRALLARLREKTERHFRVACHLVRTRPWDFFAMVEIATDRLHHAFWRFIDPSHRRYRPGAALEDEVVEYFRQLDRHFGTLLDEIGGDAVVMLASDHGAQPMRGGVRINEWLRENGYLRLLDDEAGDGPLTSERIDWGATRAWSDGGYYARVFVNQRGREPRGIVAERDADRLLEEIAAGLDEVCDPDGERIGAAAHRPRDLFRETRGIAPDLIVYFGDLAWRSLGSVGGGGWTAADNDTGADDANHAWDGVFAMRDPRLGWGDTPLQDLQLLDVGATILDRAGLDPSAEIPGLPIGSRNERRAASTGFAAHA